jgi:hypothetical protein
MFGKGCVVLLLCLIIQIFQSSIAKEYNNIKQAIEEGDISLNFRLRNERAKQEALRSANAYTLQSKIGYKSTEFYQNHVCIEAINVSSFLGKKYNSNLDGINKSEYAVITDPTGTGISNINIVAEWLPKTDLIFGRQYISLDNERMVGSNSFRQYPTSFDAITVKNDFVKNVDIFYSFINRINTYKNNIINQAGSHKLYTNLVNITWKDFLYGHATVYGYSNNDRSILKNSQNTFGVRCKSDENFIQAHDFGYEVEMAYQKTKANNPDKYSAVYLGLSANKEIIEIFKDWLVTGTLGYELIGGHNGGNPGRVFKFPLGSLYGFNGLAEGFSITPDRGLMDWYAKLELEYLDWVTFTTGLHHFQFAKGSSSHIAGREIDLDASFKIIKDLNADVRFAKLNAKNNSTRSVKRISLQVNFLVL